MRNTREERRLDNWRIAIYGNPSEGDDDLVRIGEQRFVTREEAQTIVNFLETLDRYSEFAFVVSAWQQSQADTA
ncbi:hypothetical protein BH23CHL4_BH23CHL4_29210 [soil metagenome]